MEENGREILTIDQVVAYLSLPKSTVYKLTREGVIPATKVGRHWRFSRRRIDEWIAGEKSEAKE
jgi:excisionase family DNA binding protein